MSIILLPVFIFILLLSNILTEIELTSADTLVVSVDVTDHTLLFKYDPASGKIDLLSRNSDPLNYTIAPWGCAPEITKDCIDMTNASSTYLSIAIGALIGAFISWFVYNFQKKSTVKQEENLKRLEELNERHDTILELIQKFQKHQEKLLDQILNLDKKISSAVENKENAK